MKKSRNCWFNLSWPVLVLFFSFFKFNAYGEDKGDPNALIYFQRICSQVSDDGLNQATKSLWDAAIEDLFQKHRLYTYVENCSQAQAKIKVTFRKLREDYSLEASLITEPQELLYQSEAQRYSANLTEDELKLAMSNVVLKLFQKIPFFGSVTGRDKKQVTLDLGLKNGVREGDTLKVSRISSIQKHPALKQITDIQLIPVGTIQVTKAEERFSFGEVLDEFPGETIRNAYKLTYIEKRPQPSLVTPSKMAHVEMNLSPNDAITSSWGPQYGLFRAGIGVGQLSAEQSDGGSTTTQGTGLYPHTQLFGEGWITPHWLADLELQLGYASYGYKGGQSSSASTSTTSLAFHGGYRVLLGDHPMDSHFGVLFGYRQFKWNGPYRSSDLLTKRTYSGVDLGLFGTLPVTADKLSGIQFKISTILFSSYSESPNVISQTGSITSFLFQVLGYHYFDRQVAGTVAVRFESYAMDHDHPNGARSEVSVFSILPSVQYSF